MTMSNRSARSRRASRRSSRRRLHPRRARHDNDVREVRVAGHDRRRFAFHKVRQASFRERSLEGADERRREDHVADETQADEQYLHGSAARLGCGSGQGSTVASSSSTTGISSLIG